jgi:phage terminase large subunit-like protein
MAQRPPKPTGRRNTSEPADPVTAWAKDVVAGRIVQGPHVRNACRRHLADLRHGARRGLRWDLPAALHVIGFFRDVLCLAGGQYEGIPFRLHPSQQFIIGAVFGWKRRDGSRRFRRVYLEQAKGCGKSPLLAGIGLYCMLADGEARAEVYAAAAKKDQAMIQFRSAVAMVDQSPALARRLQKSGGNPIWNLADLRTASFFRPIASTDGQSGPSPHCALCDEVHEYADGDTMEILERGFKWRRQPLLVMATNSGSDRNSVCWREHEHAVRVAAGTRTPDEEARFVGEAIDDETFSFVCALDPGDDPLTDPDCWVKANPLLGVTVSRDYLAGVVRQAAAIPGKLNSILRLHFCVWTDAAEAWMARATLEPLLAEFEPEQEHAGADVWLGLDLSGSQDLTVLAAVAATGLVRRQRDDGTEAMLPAFDAWIAAWTPRDTMHERALRDQAPYGVWAEQGFLHAESGKTIRLDFVAAELAAVAAAFRVVKLAYDRYSYRRLEDELDQLGLTLPQVEHPQGGRRMAKPSDAEAEQARRLGLPPPQGLWMPGSLLATEALFLDGRIRLRRNPVLISAIMSAVLERDPFDNRWFSKRRAVNRIDAAVALAMAIGAATATSIAAPSVYESRGILVL